MQDLKSQNTFPLSFLLFTVLIFCQALTFEAAFYPASMLVFSCPPSIPPSPLSPPQWWFVQLCPHSSCHFGCFFLLLTRLECYNCNTLPVKECFKSCSREYSCCLKGQCHEIFDFRFPPSLWLYHKGRFDFFENLRRYSQLKVHHRCRWLDTGGKWKKSLIRKVFFISFGHLWVVAVQWTPVANLPPAVHLDLRISPRIIEKIRNEPSVIFRGLGKDGSWKNLKHKISWHCSFKRG